MDQKTYHNENEKGTGSIPTANIPTANIPNASVPNASVPNASVPNAGVSDTKGTESTGTSQYGDAAGASSGGTGKLPPNLPKIENENLRRILKLVVIFLCIGFVMNLVISGGKDKNNDADNSVVQNEQSADDEQSVGNQNTNNEDMNNENADNQNADNQNANNADQSEVEEEIDLTDKTDDEIAEILAERIKTRQNQVSDTAAPASDFTYEQRDGCIYITKYNGLAEELEIPAVIDGINVCGISGNAFADNIYLKKVILPDTILYIDGLAFQNVQKLEEVVCSANLTHIGDNAFRGCSSLQSFVCKGGGESSLRYIGVDAFIGCTALQNVEIQTDTYTNFEFGVRCFQDCTSIQSVTLNGARLESVIVKEEAFKGCTGITEIPFSDKIVRLDRYAFLNCSNLTHMELPKLTAIDRGAFENCTSLTAFHVPATVTYVGEYAFKGCTALSTLTFEDVSAGPEAEGYTIANFAFQNTAITEVEIPAAYARIEYNVFADCPNLTKFVWHNSGKNVLNQTLGGDMFFGDTSLTEVYLPRTLKGVEHNYNRYPDGVTIYAMEGSVGHTFATENGYNWQPWTE